MPAVSQPIEQRVCYTRTFQAILEYAGRTENNGATPSARTLARLLGISATTVLRDINALQTAGLLARNREERIVIVGAVVLLPED